MGSKSQHTDKSCQINPEVLFTTNTEPIGYLHNARGLSRPWQKNWRNVRKRAGVAGGKVKCANKPQCISSKTRQKGSLSRPLVSTAPPECFKVDNLKGKKIL